MTLLILILSALVINHFPLGIQKVKNIFHAIDIHEEYITHVFHINFMLKDPSIDLMLKDPPIDIWRSSLFNM